MLKLRSFLNQDISGITGKGDRAGELENWQGRSSPKGRQQVFHSQLQADLSHLFTLQNYGAHNLYASILFFWKLAPSLTTCSTAFVESFLVKPSLSRLLMTFS